MSKQYKVTVYVMTPYSTIVDAENEEEAKAIALEREAPVLPAYLEYTMETEWASDGLYEFPNLGKNEEPEVEEI
tara:strand:+ start:2022 stop:2243 length:222 start_codon:yes stop_codon:yes gene_type:complete